MEIKTLDEIQFSDIHKAFTKAFADYELPPMTIDQLKQMMTRRGFNPALSMGAFDHGDLVSFTLNGIGQWNGQLTAYDTGTATVKEYRGQGLAKKIFNELVPVLIKNGISQYLLEVLQHNDKAVNLYKGVGFEITREFDYFVNEIKELEINSKLKSPITIQKMDLPSHDEVSVFWDFEPAWQNSLDSIHRTPQSFAAYGAFMDGRLIGYGITEFDSGDITQLAVHKNYRRLGIGTELFKKLIEIIPVDSMKVINTLSSDLIMKDFLKSMGIDILGKQFEMIKSI